MDDTTALSDGGAGRASAAFSGVFNLQSRGRVSSPKARRRVGGDDLDVPVAAPPAVGTLTGTLGEDDDYDDL
jgi:hypothetical protein